jgi:hypothetical protein
MRYLLVASWVLLSPLTSAVAQVSIGIGLPNVSIGINLPVYPQMARVPGYPVYYAPGVDSNYFFYDGMYWVYQGDNWYASSWYNGPWALVGPEAVPVYVLRVPVRYYRRPPPYFRGWHRDAPPRWGEHWGGDWDHRHRGWDHWDRRAAPPPAPLPAYQRQYSGDRYPRPEQQPTLHGEHYRYQPRDAAIRQAYQMQGVPGGPRPSQHWEQGEPPARGMQPHDAHRTGQPPPRAAPGMPPPHQQPQATPGQDRGHQGKGGAPEPKGHPGQPRGEERGQEHNR